MRAILKIAFHNLLQARLRTSILMVVIALVTMILIVMGALSQGFTDALRTNATALSSGHVNVAGWYKSKVTDSWPLINDVGEVERIARENTPGLDYIVRRDRSWAKVISRDHSFFVSPSGIDITAETRLKGVLELAREAEYKDGGGDARPGDFDRLTEPHTAILFAAQAKRLGVGVGDYVTLTTPTGSGRTNSIDVTVVAVARDMSMMSNWSMFVPSADIHELYQTADDTSSVVMIYLQDPTEAEAVMGHLREVYAAAGYTLMDHNPQAFFFKFEEVGGEDWTGQKLDLTVWDDEVSYFEFMSTILDSVTAILIIVLMGIIGIGIMNAILMSVRRRTAEIGTVRAIGMTRSKVLAMFVAEALMLGFFASLLGALLGTLLVNGINAAHVPLPPMASMLLLSDTLHMNIEVAQILRAIVVFTLVTGLAAISPAIRASRLEPVTAIHNTQ